MEKRMDVNIRQQVFKRDGHKCRYCGGISQPLHADHVYPYSKGGETSINNMVTSCAYCNIIKHNKVGIWPKPIGYFEGKNRPNFYVMLVTLFGIGFMASSVSVMRDMGFYSVALFVVGLCMAFWSIVKNLMRDWWE